MLRMKDIIDEKDKRLRQVSQEVTFPLSKEDLNHIDEMEEYLINSQIEEMSEKYDLRPGMGLSAVQIGVLKRYIVIVHDTEEGFISYIVINPKMTSHSEEVIYVDGGEGCLSVNRDVDGIVPRYARVTIEGYDIEGNPTLNEAICPQETDYNDAKKTCEILDIPLHRVDFIKEYWDNVFTYFLEELKKGRTPNPDLLCNKYIKFDVFKKETERLGGDYMATGHYARKNGDKLLKGIDQNKDQTYFLAQLTNEQLKNVLFPVGNLKKEEVRKIAKEIGLNVAEKKVI